MKTNMTTIVKLLHKPVSCRETLGMPAHHIEPVDRVAVKRAAALLEQADALIIAAGAGMGVDSGLPDFRGQEGFWRAYPALRAAQIDFYDIASPSAFVSAPERAWGFYGHRLALYRKTVPHPGFELLRRWGERMTHGLSVFTSNVDGQFQLAGFDPAHIHECHGSIHHLQCLEPCCEAIWPTSLVVATRAALGQAGAVERSAEAGARRSRERNADRGTAPSAGRARSRR